MRNPDTSLSFFALLMQLLDPAIGAVRHEKLGFPDFNWCAGDGNVGSCGWIPRTFLVQSRSLRPVIKVAHGERGNRFILRTRELLVHYTCCCLIWGSPFSHFTSLSLQQYIDAGQHLTKAPNGHESATFAVASKFNTNSEFGRSFNASWEEPGRKDVRTKMAHIRKL